MTPEIVLILPPRPIQSLAHSDEKYAAWFRLARKSPPGGVIRMTVQIFEHKKARRTMPVRLALQWWT